ncbi:MAG: hypothetical protein A2W31_14315 [Planctomycetes bacterium RBG_16_64_10]|nr:MAG: hypothetical protein A2W31_14315 [Planctomycetes bacterium RBG_16_64_10]
MKSCVVDASAICSAFFQEDHAVAAQRLLTSDRSLHAPDLVIAEVANVIWKRVARDEIDAAEATALLADFRQLPLLITPSDALIESALVIALETGRTIYDCLYLALAIDRGCRLVTVDKHLINALADTPLGKHVCHVTKLR